MSFAMISSTERRRSSTCYSLVEGSRLAARRMATNRCALPRDISAVSEGTLCQMWAPAAMRAFRTFVASLLIVLVAGASTRAHAETIDGIEQAWRAWMAKHDRTTGGLAVVHGGRAVGEAAMGRDTVQEPVPVASLSKA